MSVPSKVPGQSNFSPAGSDPGPSSWYPRNWVKGIHQATVAVRSSSGATACTAMQ